MLETLATRLRVRRQRVAADTSNVSRPTKTTQSTQYDARGTITSDLLAPSERLGSDPPGHIYRIDDNTVVKKGEGVRMAEVAAMRFVRSNTTVPVPLVKDAYVDKTDGQGYIIMEYIDGKRLDEAWESYSQSEKENVCRQLKAYIEQLRACKGTGVGAVGGTHCEDQFFSDDPTGYGPFATIGDFHLGLIRALRAKDQSSWTEMVVKFIEALPQQGIVLTHGDLAPRNILVRDGKVVALLDWEYAGYYPSYWEYAKTLL